MINEFVVIDYAENDDDLDRQWNDWNQMTHANRRRSNNACLAKYGMTNLERYEHFKGKFNKAPIDPVSISDPDIIQDTQDTDDGAAVQEQCKDLKSARQFVSDVQKIADKYDANFFMVTDGASGYSNGNGVSNPAVKNARQSQIDWEKKNGFDPDEDWSHIHEAKFNKLINSEDMVNGHHGVAVLIRDNGKLLMMDHVKHDFWTVPAGKVEPDQTIEEALKEEMHEELGIEIKKFKELFTRSKAYDYNGTPVTVHTHIIEVYSYSGKISNKEPNKHRSIKWMTEDEIKTLPDGKISQSTLWCLEYIDGKIMTESRLLYPEFNPSITTEEALKQGGFYDSHGTWNSIMRIPEDPNRIYRGRVECLIIKDGEIYLCKRPTDEYRLPGGSFEVKNDNETQCYNECKEEARILIKNIKNTGITYSRTYSYPADWARDLPVQWTGQYIEVYVADFDRYFNGTVATKDRDEDMYNNGRFYDIDQVYDILRPEHKRAIDICVRNINIKEDTEETVEVIGGADLINTDPSPHTVSVTNAMYDTAKEWSDRSNIKMILQRYDLDALEREYNEFMQQTYYHRKIANQEAIRIFGFNNITHYGYLKSKLLKKDETEVKVDDIINNDDTDSVSTVSEFYSLFMIPEKAQRKINIIKEELCYNYDKIIIHNMLDDLWKESADFVNKVIIRNFINETIEFMNNDNHTTSLLPYFTPNEMEELGVFSENVEDNYYKAPSDWAISEWYELYSRTGYPGNEWYRNVGEAFGLMMKNPTPENKQRVLEYGWNPEIGFNLDIIRETSKLTKEKLGNKYNVEVVDITESLNDLDDYQEVPYIPKNINKYELSSYLCRSIEMEHTNGRIFTDYDGRYVAHITIYNNDIMGIGSWYKGLELLTELVSWAMDEKKVNRCFCKKSDITLKRILSSKGFVPTNDDRIIIYVLPEVSLESVTENILTQDDLAKYVTFENDHKASAYEAREILNNILNDIGYQGYSQYKNCFEIRDVESDDGMYIFAKWDTSSLDSSQFGVFFDILADIRSRIVAKLDGFIVNGVNRAKIYGFLGTLPSPTLSENTMTTKERNELKDSDFGLPKLRKYPLNNEAHVRSAIKFFNYVEKENEEELAKNINKKIDKYELDNIEVGKNNRFSKYYKPYYTEASKPKKDKDLLPVYIVTCYTASPMGRAIQKFTHNLYTHAAIGFEATLDKLYSFNVVHSHGKNGGLSEESIGQYIHDNYDADLNVSVVYLKKKDYNKLKNRLEVFLNNEDKTSYNFKNLFNIMVNKVEDSAEQFSMVCSQFVDFMFKSINVDLTHKPSNLVTPGDLSKVDNPKVYKVYEGKARGYNPKKTEVILSKLIGNIGPIKESTFIKNARLGLYYAIPIFEAKELPIGFDDNGALLIKNYKTIDYDVEYSRSNKLLKSYKANKNWTAMEYELCKLWFMNTVLLKKIEVAKDKDEKAALVKIRAKIMNDFTIYLNEVNKNVDGFNFSEYYEQTPFSDTVIKISGSTLKYSAQYFKAAIKAMV